MNLLSVRTKGSRAGAGTGSAGLAVWLLEKIRGARRAGAGPKLALLERISLAPRQTLSLVEAEGRRFLVASSPDGAAAFYPLESGRAAKQRSGRARASW